jgi:hypothetical protein
MERLIQIPTVKINKDQDVPEFGDFLPAQLKHPKEAQC